MSDDTPITPWTPTSARHADRTADPSADPSADHTHPANPGSVGTTYEYDIRLVIRDKDKYFLNYNSIDGNASWRQRTPQIFRKIEAVYALLRMLTPEISSGHYPLTIEYFRIDNTPVVLHEIPRPDPEIGLHPSTLAEHNIKVNFIDPQTGYIDPIAWNKRIIEELAKQEQERRAADEAEAVAKAAVADTSNEDAAENCGQFLAARHIQTLQDMLNERKAVKRDALSRGFGERSNLSFRINDMEAAALKWVLSKLSP